MEHQDILHRCFRCGYCKLPANFTDINCPAYLAFGFETYSPGGRMWLLRAWLDEKIDTTDRFAEIMFACATCGNCTSHCAMPDFRDRILQAFTAGKEAMLEAGRVPTGVRDYLIRMQRHGNAYGKPAKKRANWALEAGIAPYEGQEYLFFAGDVGAFDPRGQEIAGSVAEVMARAGIDFGVMAEGECDDGNDVKALGETDLFAELAKQNIEAFDKKGVRKIITLSPHALNAMKNEYPAHGGQYQVFHYTQLLAFAMGKLTFAENADPITVTFHDPCYLGRHNWDFESPRMALRAVPGLSLAEMDRNRQNALCCGGGGGNLFTDVLGAADESAARSRVREAAGTGAQILAVACPLCAVMLEDAVKTAGLEDRLKVREISELVLQNLSSVV